MNKIIFWLLLLACCSNLAQAQKTDRRLQRAIVGLAQGFHGDIGIYVKNLKNNKVAILHADSSFPTASMVKLPILIGIMEQIREGALTYHQPLKYRDSLLYAGADLLGSFKDTERIELGKALLLMMSLSDNTASLWLQSLAGGGTRINQLLDSLGFHATRVNSRTPGREQHRNQYGWGQSTPQEMAGLLEKIYRGEVISRSASDQMLRLLNRSYFDGVAVGQVPPYAAVFSKYGAVNQTRNEMVLVKGRKSCYVFCVMTKNNQDQSWTQTNEAWQLTQKISALLWHYFEPGDHWKPAPDAGQWTGSF